MKRREYVEKTKLRGKSRQSDQTYLGMVKQEAGGLTNAVVRRTNMAARM